MTRTKRFEGESGMHHVYARGVGRCIIFEDDEDRREFVGLLGRYLCTDELSLHAWCLMDNHYHLLTDCHKSDIEMLSTAMRNLNSLYAGFFNKRHGRVGHLFQDRFKSEPVDTDEYFLSLLRYIHQNPMKAGLVPSCAYPWSSFNGYLTSPWLVDNEPAASLFDGVEEFERFHDIMEVDARCGRLERSGNRSVADEELIELAREVLGSKRLESVAGMGRAARDEALRSLKQAHFTLRQVERLTGVPKSVVARA